MLNKLIKILYLILKVVKCVSNFFSLMNRPHTKAVSSGTDEQLDYIEDFDNVTGEKYLKVVGKHSQYDFIQASAPGLDIYSLIDSHRINPELKNYVIEDKINDFTKMPSSLMEAQDLMLYAERIFGQLPLEVRSSFGNNVNSFIAGIGTGDTVSKLSQFYNKSAVSNSKVTVKEDKNNG